MVTAVAQAQIPSAQSDLRFRRAARTRMVTHSRERRRGLRRLQAPCQAAATYRDAGVAPKGFYLPEQAFPAGNPMRVIQWIGVNELNGVFHHQRRRCSIARSHAAPLRGFVRVQAEV